MMPRHIIIKEEDLRALEKDALIERSFALQKHVAALKSTPIKVALSLRPLRLPRH
jgi:hypothetical protein